MASNSSSISKQLLSSLNLRWVLISLGVLAIGWVAFFDSHSLLKRAQWHWEAQALRAENEHLQEDIESIERQLEALESNETIEEIAREEYGMHRPGETVYRVEFDN